MSKIRFWRWQHTDELGMPCPTRLRLSDVEGKAREDSDDHPWALQTRNPEPSRTDLGRATAPK